MPFEPGWIERQFAEVEANIAAWPRWLRREAGVPQSEGEAMSDQLLPCPFCGGEAQTLGGCPYSLTVCTNCGGRAMGRTLAEAIAAWNRRGEVRR